MRGNLVEKDEIVSIVTAKDVVDLADWRRRVFEMYRAVRHAGEPSVAWRTWRRERDELFRSHPQTPLLPDVRTGFAGLDYFEYDPAARVTAELTPVPPSSWNFEASEGTLVLDCVAKASFELYGEARALEVYQFRSYGGGLFLSFQDATSGKESYGGCRYLLDTVKGADLGMEGEELVLDFNFAYQPSCAYNSRWVCPLAPPNNRLSVQVRAGELWNKG